MQLGECRASSVGAVLVVVTRVVRTPQAPRHRQRTGQIVGFCGDVGSSVCEPPRLAQQHQRIGAEQVRQHDLVGSEPWQPRLHPVEQLTPAEALHVLAAPRLADCQRCGTFPHGSIGTHLARRVHLRRGKLCDRTLIGDRELREAVDLVAPQVDAHRHLGRRAEDVHDPAAHCDLAAVLDLMLTAISPGHQLRHEFAEVAPIASCHAHHRRCWGNCVGAEPLQQRSNRGDDHLEVALAGAGGGSQPLQRCQSAAHRLGRRAHSFERQRFPRSEQCYVLLPEPGAEVFGVALGFMGRRRHHQDRQP